MSTKFHNILANFWRSQFCDDWLDFGLMMNGRGSSSEGRGSSGRFVIPQGHQGHGHSPLSEVSQSQSEPESLALKLTNGIMGGEKTRVLPSAFISLTPLMKESFLTKEYCAVAKQEEKLGGLYVIPSAQFCDLWFGVLFVRAGSSPYQGGAFRFTVRFPNDFPTSTTLPIVTFQPPVFHPSIHHTRGLFDLKRHFKNGWNQQNHQVYQILKIVRSSFYKVESISCVNKQAHDLLENDPVQFNQRGQKEVESSLKRLYDECPAEYNRDAYWMKFSPYDSSIHDAYLRKVKVQSPKPANLSSEAVAKSGAQRGLGWMDTK